MHDTEDSTSLLTVAWLANPALPGNVDGDQLKVTSAKFRLDRLQVIGDAGPGDPRTTRSSFDLAWDATHTAGVTRFDAAPPGLYSLISFDFEAEAEDGASFDIVGEVKIDGEARPFHVSDDEGLRISFPCDAMVRPDGMTNVEIELRLDAPLKAIDFTTIPDRNGTLELDSSDPQIGALRTNLIKAFKLGTVSATPAT